MPFFFPYSFSFPSLRLFPITPATLGIEWEHIEWRIEKTREKEEEEREKKDHSNADEPVTDSLTLLFHLHLPLSSPSILVFSISHSPGWSLEERREAECVMFHEGVPFLSLRRTVMDYPFSYWKRKKEKGKKKILKPYSRVIHTNTYSVTFFSQQILCRESVTTCLYP